MKQTTIVEYGVEIAADLMIAPPDAEHLELEPGHPGLGDTAYVARRQELFDLCRRHRLERLGPPLVAYTPEETRIWRDVSTTLDALHRTYASRIYLDAKRALGISTDAIPQLRDLSARIEQETGMHLVPAEGPIAYRTFYGYIADRGFPVTQFLRHGSHPEFTPEPDMVHDCLGHVPALINHDYAALLTRLGQAAMAATTGEQVLALKRLSWFSIEFGLIQEEGLTKVFGAGILSSTSEIPFSLSDDVERRRWKTEEVIATDYDPSRMQSVLFVVPSFAFLRFEVEQLVERLGLQVPHGAH
jgi:phenylalanine-4-hydroxylase